MDVYVQILGQHNKITRTDSTHSEVAGVNLDYDAASRVVGVEVLDAVSVAIDGELITAARESGNR
jgi:hypothetical protein